MLSVSRCRIRATCARRGTRESEFIRFRSDDGGWIPLLRVSSEQRLIMSVNQWVSRGFGGCIGFTNPQALLFEEASPGGLAGETLRPQAYTATRIVSIVQKLHHTISSLSTLDDDIHPSRPSMRPLTAVNHDTLLSQSGVSAPRRCSPPARPQDILHVVPRTVRKARHISGAIASVNSATPQEFSKPPNSRSNRHSEPCPALQALSGRDAKPATNPSAQRVELALHRRAR